MAFDELAEALPAAYDANIGTLSMDVLSIVVFALMEAYHKMYPPAYVVRANSSVAPSFVVSVFLCCSLSRALTNPTHFPTSPLSPLLLHRSLWTRKGSKWRCDDELAMSGPAKWRRKSQVHHLLKLKLRLTQRRHPLLRPWQWKPRLLLHLLLLHPEAAGKAP